MTGRLGERVLTLRARLKRLPGGAVAWRAGVGIVGALLTLAGLALVPLPGPGWLVVFLGLSVLSTEFPWAARLLQWVRRKVAAFARLASTLGVWLRVFAGTVMAAGLAAAIWAYLAWKGVGPFHSDA